MQVCHGASAPLLLRRKHTNRNASRSTQGLPVSQEIPKQQATFGFATGAEWAANIAEHPYSGTCNNQYPVVDLKRFRPRQVCEKP